MFEKKKALKAARQYISLQDDLFYRHRVYSKKIRGYPIDFYRAGFLTVTYDQALGWCQEQERIKDAIGGQTLALQRKSMQAHLQTLQQCSVSSRRQVMRYANRNGWNSLMTAAIYDVNGVLELASVMNQLDEEDLKYQVLSQVNQYGFNALMLGLTYRVNASLPILEMIDSLGDERQKGQILLQTVKANGVLGGWMALHRYDYERKKNAMRSSRRDYRKRRVTETNPNPKLLAGILVEDFNDDRLKTKEMVGSPRLARKMELFLKACIAADSIMCSDVGKNALQLACDHQVEAVIPILKLIIGLSDKGLKNQLLSSFVEHCITELEHKLKIKDRQHHFTSFLSWLHQQAEHENAWAQFFIGQYYYQSHHSRHRSAEFLLAAVQQGNLFAHYYMAMLLEQKKPVMACGHYERAAYLGVLKARGVLKRLNNQGAVEARYFWAILRKKDPYAIKLLLEDVAANGVMINYQMVRARFLDAIRRLSRSGKNKHFSLSFRVKLIECLEHCIELSDDALRDGLLLQKQALLYDDIKPASMASCTVEQLLSYLNKLPTLQDNVYSDDAQHARNLKILTKQISDIGQALLTIDTGDISNRFAVLVDNKIHLLDMVLQHCGLEFELIVPNGNFFDIDNLSMKDFFEVIFIVLDDDELTTKKEKVRVYFQAATEAREIAQVQNFVSVARSLNMRFFAEDAPSASSCSSISISSSTLSTFR